jgi:mono/diheme cytochrome c family protein
MSTIIRPALILLVAALGGCATADDQAAAKAGQVAETRGLAVAEQHCGQCHAIGRTGSSPVPSAPVWRDLVLVRDVDGLAESFAEGSFVHSDGPVQMPEFTLEPADIDALLAYMKSLRQG